MESKGRFDWQAALTAGALASISALLLTLVGMVLAFGKRYIVSGILTVGHTLLFMNMVLAAYLYLRRSPSAGLRRLLGGTLAGLVPGVAVALWVAVGQVINLRAVFINSSADLYTMLVFGLPWYAGLILLVVISALLGLLTAVLSLLPSRVQRAVLVAVLVLLMAGLLQDLLRVMFQGWGFFGHLFLWMFPSGGISILGMFVLLIFSGGLNYLWQWRGGALRERIGGLPDKTRRSLRWGSWGLAALLVLAAPYILGSYPSEVLDMVGLFALMGLGLNIVVGFCGLLDLGYVAFFAIGAYTMAVLTSPERFALAGTGMQPWNFWAALPVAMFAALLSGVILGIPVLNTRGDYLAIVTLGFGEIVRLVFLSDWLRPYVGGAQGIQLIPTAQIGPLVFKPPQGIFYLILAGLVVVVFVSLRLRDSRLGRAWMAVREDEDVAQAMGIPLVQTKLLAFATGATFAGLSGAIFASKLGSIYPHSFQLLYSIYVLCLLIVGGMGSIPGALVGSLLLIGLPELLREFAEYRMLVYGAVLVFMMLTKPEGFLPPQPGRRRRAEEAK